ncbi:MAG: Holliday junction resolvase RuvX [Gammaproteobacteria bacterium]|nr:Holliday junction resolvase RuvX [Gammaproteobacteria bacterium]
MKDEILLAFDVGRRRTGVASGQTRTMTSQPAGQLLVRNGRFDWLEVDKLIAGWTPDKIVIGDPGSSDPHLRKVINRLKSYIRQQHKLPIVDIDETLTSSAANSELEGLGLSLGRKTKLRDQFAACLILQGYFSTIG